MLISSSTSYTIIIRPLLDLEMFYSAQQTKHVLSSDEILWVKVVLDHLKLHQHDDDKDYNDEGKKEVFECEYASRSVSGPRIADTWSVIGAVVLYRNTFCMICQYLLDVCITSTA